MLHQDQHDLLVELQWRRIGIKRSIKFLQNSWQSTYLIVEHRKHLTDIDDEQHSLHDNFNVLIFTVVIRLLILALKNTSWVTEWQKDRQTVCEINDWPCRRHVSQQGRHPHQCWTWESSAVSQSTSVSAANHSALTHTRLCSHTCKWYFR